jgi:enamine deaminase RidA (YjgF/YER057c/UK114 family)
MRVRTTARVGDLITVVGMVGRDASGVVVEGVTAQTRRALERIEEALAEHGRDRHALVRLRVYLTEIGDWPAVRDEITSFLGEDWPPAAVVQVQALVEPSMKVELEVDAAA